MLYFEDMEEFSLELLTREEKRDSRGRRVLSREEWLRYLSAYDASGLTQRKFCDREGLVYATFVSWLGRRRRGDLKVDCDSLSFHELSLPALGSGSRGSSGPGLEICLPDGTLLRGQDAAELSLLFHGLRRGS